MKLALRVALQTLSISHIWFIKPDERKFSDEIECCKCRTLVEPRFIPQ